MLATAGTEAAAVDAAVRVAAAVGVGGCALVEGTAKGGCDGSGTVVGAEATGCVDAAAVELATAIVGAWLTAGGGVALAPLQPAAASTTKIIDATRRRRRSAVRTVTLALRGRLTDGLHRPVHEYEGEARARSRHRVGPSGWPRDPAQPDRSPGASRLLRCVVG
jgi:hypothetical protein